jgi:hypothetical protein
MRSISRQRQAVEVAHRLLSGQQSGPKAGTKEGAYIAAGLADAIETLRLVEDHQDEFADIAGAGKP